MAWVKLDDHFDQHPKLQSVGPLGLALWVSGIAYCNRNLTDGRIPWSVARSLIATKHLDPEPDDGKRRVWTPSLVCGMGGQDGDEMIGEVIRMLIAAGLWDETSDGYQVHDYLGFQPSKQQVLAERERDRNRKRKPESGENPNGIQPESAAPDPVSVPRDSKAERPRARKPRAPRPQLSLEELAAKFGLPLARVKANAAKISALGTYSNEYRALLAWCAKDAAEPPGKLPPVNGAAHPQSADEHPDFVYGRKERERVLRELQ